MANIPIWQGVPYDLGSSAGKVAYLVRKGGTAGDIIYYGNSAPAPDNSHKVDLANVTRNYLDSALPSTGNGIATQSGSDAFFLEKSGSVSTIGVVVDDWSYRAHTGTNYNAYPKKVVYRDQWLFISSLGSSSVVVKTYVGSSLKGTKTISVSSTRLTHVCVKPSSLTGGSTCDRINISGYGDIKVVDRCTDYALYYRNAFGGWDYFPCAVRNERSATPSKTTFVNDGGMTKVLSTNVGIRYTIATGRLSDDASSALWEHLLTSPDVYLYDFGSDTFHPVVLDDVEQAEKVYRNGYPFVAYTIGMTFSEKRERR